MCACCKTSHVMGPIVIPIPIERESMQMSSFAIIVMLAEFQVVH